MHFFRIKNNEKPKKEMKRKMTTKERKREREMARIWQKCSFSVNNICIFNFLLENITKKENILNTVTNIPKCANKSNKCYKNCKYKHLHFWWQSIEFKHSLWISSFRIQTHKSPGSLTRNIKCLDKPHKKTLPLCFKINEREIRKKKSRF